MILNVCANDYANYSHDNARALRSIGLECLDVVIQKHIYNYDSQSNPLNKIGIAYYMKQAEVIQITHTNAALYNLAKEVNPNAKIIIYHTGTTYRKRPEHFNRLFSGEKIVTDQTEFMEQGDFKYIVSPVDYERAPLYREGLKKIAHYPSVATTKGTPKILEMLSKVKEPNSFKYSTTIVPHSKQIERLSQCDIYIELFKPEIDGNKYGCFGVTALEAASLGKIVITQNLFEDVYTNEYGYCPLSIANTEEEFINLVDGFLSISRRNFNQLQKDTHEIMKDNHSFESTGHKIANFIYES